MKKTPKKRLPKLSVKGLGNVIRTDCGICHEVADLSWIQFDYGMICQDCARSVIEAEMTQAFPTAEANLKRGQGE